MALAVRGMRRAQDSAPGEEGDISAGLFGKHEVNLAQNLGVWFWGPKPKLKKKPRSVKEFLRASKLRGGERHSQKM